VAIAGLIYAALLAVAMGLDALARPRAWGSSSGKPNILPRNWRGLLLLAYLTTAFFGLFLAVCGNGLAAAALTLGMQVLLLGASNAKYAMLGEPLLFSDLALVGAMFRHPQFYLSAVAGWQRVAAVLVAAVLLSVLVRLFVPDLGAHLGGMALLLFGLSALVISLRRRSFRRLTSEPDAHADTRCLGLQPTLLLYWLRWRESCDPPACPHVERHVPESGPGESPEIVVIVQCESFADPAELFGDPALAPSRTLPGLFFAQQNAWQWGDLAVSGFGAYTMRTEYGVLFGREEEALGFRRYDPFLTALGEASYALPARLKAAGWRSLFLHPHDMRFYGRDRIMPAGGFAEVVGEDRFAPPRPGEGRYVTDAAMAGEILALAEAGSKAGVPTMLYAVTIENHGPWGPEGAPGRDLVPGYLRLARNSDAMLTALLDGLRALKRPAVLVFFGDHRPSIPGATAPGGDRHTPYVMLRIDAMGGIASGENRRADLTPAGLHHAILDAAMGAPVCPMEA
jgi:hypothetical protein